MTPKPNTTRLMNFVVGVALLTMLAPLHGEPVDKAAGVRNAVELAGKKFSLARPRLGCRIA